MNVQETLTQMTLREKIGQTMLMLPDKEKEMELGGGSLREFFRRYPVSGYFMDWMLFEGVAEADKMKVQLERIAEYKKNSGQPLIFQQDYESGVNLPGMTPFPNEMTLGAADSEEAAFAYGRAIALESRSAGISWVLHPVADLNLNRFNPITNIRSVSDDPERAARILRAQITGLQENGVAATIKHFPGDGVDFRDQHLLTTCNSLSMKDWEPSYGFVYRELIQCGTAAVMPGHITLPAYQKEKKHGLYLPATLSSELLTGLLKKELGFDGVIISDAMMMGGFRGWYPDRLEGEIQCFLAGADMLLWPSYAFLDEVEKRIHDGRIPIERLDDAAGRVLSLKQCFGLLEPGYEPVRPLRPQELQCNKETAGKICRDAVTLLRDRNKLLPISPERSKHICLVAVTPHNRKTGDRLLKELQYTQRLLQQEGFDADFRHNLLYESDGWEEELSKRYDLTIFLTARIPHAPIGPLQFFNDEAESVWGINAMAGSPVIVISYGDPYLNDEYFKRIPCCINAYSGTASMQEAVIEALTGKIPFAGSSPVKLEYSWPVNMRYHT
jgi:beta-N-acetylhexosaminidase